VLFCWTAPTVTSTRVNSSEHGWRMWEAQRQIFRFIRTVENKNTVVMATPSSVSTSENGPHVRQWELSPSAYASSSECFTAEQTTLLSRCSNHPRGEKDCQITATSGGGSEPSVACCRRLIPLPFLVSSCFHPPLLFSSPRRLG
jgi:hypothetical protein